MIFIDPLYHDIYYFDESIISLEEFSNIPPHTKRIKYLHRLDGPAYIRTNGNEGWFQNGQIHRTDGPAYILDGQKYWFLNDEQYRSFEEWVKDTPLSNEEKIALKLEHS